MAHYMLHARAVIATFGHRVRANRRALGISQPELGRLARVTPKFIGQIERGESNPSLATMVLVADALGADLLDLLQAENSPPVIESFSLRLRACSPSPVFCWRRPRCGMDGHSCSCRCSC